MTETWDTVKHKPGQQCGDPMPLTGCCCSLLITESRPSKSYPGSKEGSWRRRSSTAGPTTSDLGDYSSLDSLRLMTQVGLDTNDSALAFEALTLDTMQDGKEAQCAAD